MIILITNNILVTLFYLYIRLYLLALTFRKELNFLSWEEAHKLAQNKLRNFTLEEKLSLLYGTKNNECGCTFIYI